MPCFLSFRPARSYPPLTSPSELGLSRRLHKQNLTFPKVSPSYSNSIFISRLAIYIRDIHNHIYEAFVWPNAASDELMPSLRVFIVFVFAPLTWTTWLPGSPPSVTLSSTFIEGFPRYHRSFSPCNYYGNFKFYSMCCIPRHRNIACGVRSVCSIKYLSGHQMVRSFLTISAIFWSISVPSIHRLSRHVTVVVVVSFLPLVLMLFALRVPLSPGIAEPSSSGIPPVFRRPPSGSTPPPPGSPHF